jgi:uncharacterized protein (DUF1330 family)
MDMTAYAVFEVNVTDQSWQENYMEPTAKLVARHGGRYLALDSPEKIEGDRTPPGALVIVEFPSIEAAKAWHADPEYQPLIKLRQSGSTSEALLVAGK